MNFIVVAGIASIIIGLICVGCSYWSIHRASTRRPALILGLMALLFLTLIPTTLAVFFAATNGG